MKVYKGGHITVSPKAGASAKGEPLTGVMIFATARDRDALVGRKTKLTSVNVTRTVSDCYFYVGSGTAQVNQEMTVLLDRRLDVGSEVSVSGKQVPNAAMLAIHRWP